MNARDARDYTALNKGVGSTVQHRSTEPVKCVTCQQLSRIKSVLVPALVSKWSFETLRKCWTVTNGTLQQLRKKLLRGVGMRLAISTLRHIWIRRRWLRPHTSTCSCERGLSREPKYKPKLHFHWCSICHVCLHTHLNADITRHYRNKITTPRSTSWNHLYQPQQTRNKQVNART